jgi:hypothetical protein
LFCPKLRVDRLKTGDFPKKWGTMREKSETLLAKSTKVDRLPAIRKHSQAISGSIPQSPLPIPPIIA